MKIKVMLALSLWLTLQACASPLQRAEQLLREKKYAQAESVLSELEQQDPENVHIQTRLVQALFHTQTPLAALQKFYPLYQNHRKESDVIQTYHEIRQEFERFDHAIQSQSTKDLKNYLPTAPNNWFRERGEWLLLLRKQPVHKELLQHLSESQDSVIQQLTQWKQGQERPEELEKLLDLYPDSSLRPLWHWSLIEQLSTHQNREKVNSAMVRFKEETTDAALKAEIVLRQGEYNLEKSPTAALNYLRSFLQQSPQHPRGRSLIYTLREKLSKYLSLTDHQFIAEEAFKRFMYQTASGEMQASNPQGKEALFKAGLYARKAEFYELAQEIFSQLIKDYPHSQEAGLARVQQASLLRIKKAYPAALNQLRAIRADYQSMAEVQAEALWEEGIIHDFLNQSDQQATVCRQLIEKVPDSSHAAEALWIVVWHTYLHQRYSEMVALIEQYRELFKGHESESKFLYWLARAQEQLNQVDQAQKHYLELQSGPRMDYYTHRSRLRLQALEQKGADTFSVAYSGPTQSIAPILPNWTQALEERLNAKEAPTKEWPEAEQLFYLQQYQDFLKIAEYSTDPKLNQLRGYFLNHAGHHYAAITEYRYKVKENEAYLPIAFPQAWFSSIEKEAQKYGLSPFLVAGLTWQESQYKPDIQSWVGATGLMQIMPATAEQIATALGLKKFDLKDPETNLQMGTWYLNSTHQKFKGNALLAVASYNAGPGASERWRKQFPHLSDDALAESITYPETRDYVKKVFTAAWIYQSLYGKQALSSPPTSG